MRHESFDTGRAMVVAQNSNHFVGTLVADPFHGVAPGTSINIDQWMFKPPNEPSGAYLIENMACFHGAVLSVHFFTNEWNVVEGSAVMIAPGIAFGAAHVFLPLKQYITTGKLKMFLGGYAASGPRYWDIVQIHPIENSDLVILTLKYIATLPADRRFAQAMITTRLPAIGEQVLIAGFRASKEQVEADSDMAFPVIDGDIKHGAELRLSVGEVTQHHLALVDVPDDAPLPYYCVAQVPLHVTFR
jgi:hypothetical protein